MMSGAAPAGAAAASAPCPTGAHAPPDMSLRMASLARIVRCRMSESESVVTTNAVNATTIPSSPDQSCEAAQPHL